MSCQRRIIGLWCQSVVSSTCDVSQLPEREVQEPVEVDFNDRATCHNGDCGWGTGREMDVDLDESQVM